VPTFHRYVAIGDSTTEGLEDPDPRGGYRGWADRLAMIIAAAQTEPLEYANIGIRGYTLNEIRTNQFDQAIAMQPDLMTIVGGVNDVIGLRPDFAQLQADYTAMFGGARANGITVLSLTMPDPAAINPLGGYLRERMLRLNEIVHAEADRYGVLVLALERFEIATDTRMWSDDWLHGNTLGHERVAHGFGWLLGIDGEDDRWTRPLSETAEQLARRERMGQDLHWARNHLGPWLVKGLRGIPHGRGVEPKRAVPTVVQVEPEGLARSASSPPAPAPVRQAGSSLTPYLSVDDARAAIDWYATALGAVVTHPPIVMPDGRVGHAELELHGARVMLADAHPEIASPAPTPGGSPVTLHLEVGDVDAVVAAAQGAGAQVDREPGDGPAGRIAVFRDPFGHRWMINGPVAPSG